MDTVGLVPGAITFLGLAVAGCVLVALTSAGSRSQTFQTNLFLYGFATRFAASIVIYQFGLINTLKDEDGSGWEVGLGYKAIWEGQQRTIVDLPTIVLEAYEGHHRGYYYMLGGFFFLTGLEGRLPAAALNGFFGAMTAVLTYRTARTLLPERAATWAGWYTCLFPSLILWSAQTVKEPVVIFLEAVALYGAIRLRISSLNPAYITLCVGAIVLLMPFRFYAAYVAAVTVLVGLIVPSTRMSGRDLGRLVAFAGLALLISMFGGLLSSETTATYLDAEYIDKYRRNSADTTNEGQGSGVFVEADVGTSAGLGLALLVGGLHLFLAPFPWQWFGGIRRMLVAPEVVFWWWLLVRYVIPGTRHVVRTQLSAYAPILLFLLLMSALYAVMFNNVGLVYRQRAQLLPWMFILAAAGREFRLRQRPIVG